MMNQEWYCASSVNVQTTIAFITLTYDVLRTQIWYFIWYFIKVAVTRLFCGKAQDKVVTFCRRSFVRKENSPTSIKPEATPGGRCLGLVQRLVAHSVYQEWLDVAHCSTYSNVHPPAQHNTTQHNTTQHNTTQHNTTQHNTTQHNTTQHNTTQQHTVLRAQAQLRLDRGALLH